LGAGAWGLTLAKLASEPARAVTVWTRDNLLAETLQKTRTRGRPAGLVLSACVQFTSDLSLALSRARIVVVAISSAGLRGLFQQMEPLIGDRLRTGQCSVLCASKGLEQGTGLLPTQIYEEVMGLDAAKTFVALGGPSHAEEVCRVPEMPTAVVMAGDANHVGLVRGVFHRRFFRVYPIDDPLTVELGGALKNIIAIAAGMSDGLGYGDNTRAAIISRGLREMTRAVRVIHPQANLDVLSGLGGLGDLVGTATSAHSRNRRFGELLGRQVSLEDALKRIGQVVEGIYACRAMHEVAQRYDLHMPLTKLVHDVVHLKVPLGQAVAELLSRDTNPEDI
jgi:glycerol-3-phosphate dehydrogenase (NAD(P)+)